MPSNPPPDSLTIRAPAKINLFLHVVGRRADGYHLIQSLVVFAGVHDVLAVAPSAALSLEIDGPYAAALDPAADNLVMRAARSLADAAGVDAGAAIRLTKRIPVAAGIGGGSADAAAALKALSALWGVALSDDDLHRIALALGADVPVCLAGGSAMVGGIGDSVVPVSGLPEMAMLLVNPGVMVPTAAVFQARGGAYSPLSSFTAAAADAAALAGLLSAWRNDLTAAACAIAPEIETVLRALGDAPGCLLARLSGSGPTCFGLFADAAAARAAAQRISAQHADWWVCAAPAPVEAGQPA